MTELALAEHQRRLGERLAELELRVDLLSKVLAGVTSGGLDRPAPVLTGVVCGQCGADRLAEGCRLVNPSQCTFAGVAR